MKKVFIVSRDHIWNQYWKRYVLELLLSQLFGSFWRVKELAKKSGKNQ